MASNPNNRVDPDLSWHQVHETVRMLNLAVAQISMAMMDSDESVSTLSGSVTNIVARLNEVADKANHISGDNGNAAIKASISGNCSLVQSDIHHVLISLQFYDRLSQRISHVEHALRGLTALISKDSDDTNPEEWVALQHNIRSRYSMVEEQHMFDSLLKGASIEEALEQVKQKLDEGDIDDIELF